MSRSPCDVVCIGPHSDDVEIALGGTVARLAAAGRRVWIVDLTRGELASNACPEERWREAEAASASLGIAGRAQLDLPDGFVDDQDRRQVAALVAVLRLLRPHWLLVAPEPRRHPDHLAAPRLVRRAAFHSRLAAFRPQAGEARWWPEPPTLQAAEAWPCERLAVTALPGQRPSFVMDVGSSWDRKVAALGCFASQFRRGTDRRPTHINDPSFLASIEERARHWGRLAGVTLGEALVTDVVPVLEDLGPGGWG